MKVQYRCSLTRSAAALLAALFLILSTNLCQATPLLPGGVQFPAVAEPDPVGASLVFSTGPINVVSSTFSGTLRSSVWSGDTSNPYGLDKLTFTYEIFNDALSIDDIAELAVVGFDTYQTDVSYVPTLSPGYTPPTFMARTATGNVMTFDFIAPGLAPGNNSNILVVQTDSTTYHSSIASLIDGSAVTVASVAPVPEPTTIAMLAMGALGLFGFRRAVGRVCRV